jgi:hypothetical protein
MVERPDRVASEPGIPARILTAAANAAVATAIKKVLERSLQRVMSSQTRRDHDADRSARAEWRDREGVGADRTQ